MFEARKLYRLSNEDRARIKNIYYVHVYLLQANRITLTAYNVFISTSVVDGLHFYLVFVGVGFFSSEFEFLVSIHLFCVENSFHMYVAHTSMYIANKIISAVVHM